MNKSVIIVAGGSGLRMGHDIPKQFLLIAGTPILMHTIHRFAAFDSSMQIVVVLPQSQVGYWQELCQAHHFTIPHEIALGGEARFNSVQNGLSKVIPGNLVAIHDGVRPFVSVQTLRACFDMAQQQGNAIPVIDVIESVRQIDGLMSRSVDRSLYRLVQTPQVFQWEQINAAYNLPFDSSFTDDASVVEKAGFIIHLASGNRENIKITTPIDLMIGELFATMAEFNG
jgi:2-C-methyl-D-erythritol 4-phosphate cytidylyltransferase